MSECKRQDNGNGWVAFNGDNVEVMRGLKDESIDYSFYSLPFGPSMFTYSASEHDAGNCRNWNEFWQGYSYCLEQLYRVTKAGRNMSIHCMPMPTSLVRDGVISILDFPGEIVRAASKAGFFLHGDVIIWKSPVVAQARTHAKGLTHAVIAKDGCDARMGLYDRILTFKKPGENKVPVPLLRANHTDEEWRSMYGSARDGSAFPLGVSSIDFEKPQNLDRISIELWQIWASPVWTDINQSDTLQYMSARDDKDEKHICPMQLEPIQRLLDLYTNPGDVVLDPYGGIASTGHVAMGGKTRRGYCVSEPRKFVYIELKDSYYRQGVENLRRVEPGAKGEQASLFTDEAPAEEVDDNEGEF